MTIKEAYIKGYYKAAAKEYKDKIISFKDNAVKGLKTTSKEILKFLIKHKFATRGALIGGALQAFKDNSTTADYITAMALGAGMGSVADFYRNNTTGNHKNRAINKILQGNKTKKE